MASALDAVLQVAMGRMTADPQERRNVFWLTLAYLFSGTGAALFGGDLWNGFLTQTGFSLARVGWVGSAAGLANAFGLIAFMGLADRLQRRVRTYVICISVTALAPLLTVGVAVIPRVAFPLSALFVTLLLVVIVQALITAIPVMLDYPVLARAAPVGIRGRLFGITTTAYGLLGIGLGWLSAGVLKNVTYPLGYAWCFLAAAAAITLRAASFSRIRELPELAVDGASRSALPFAAIVDVLRLKEFQWLAGPHVVRGLAMSVVTLAVPVGMRHLGLPKHYPGYATSIATLAMVLGGVAVGLIADRWGPASTTLWGDVLYALGMAMVALTGGHPVAFLCLYLLMQFGRFIEDNSVPLGAINIVPAEHLGAFSAARLMILYGSGAIGAPLFGYLADHCDPVIVFGAAACIKALTGLWFCLVFQRKPPTPPRHAEPMGEPEGEA